MVVAMYPVVFILDFLIVVCYHTFGILPPPPIAILSPSTQHVVFNMILSNVLKINQKFDGFFFWFFFLSVSFYRL